MDMVEADSIAENLSFLIYDQITLCMMGNFSFYFLVSTDYFRKIL